MTDLLHEFVKHYPFQPATAYWRAIEIGHVVSQPFPEGRGLDLGCGDGKLTKIILDLVGHKNLVGIDIDPEEVSHAESLGIYEDVHTCPADSIPESDDSFDFVFSNSVLEHIDPIYPVLEEVGRILKPGGYFVFTVPSHNFHNNMRTPFFIDRPKYLKDLDHRLAHFRYWNIEEWDTHLKDAGMTVDKSSFYLSPEQIHRWQVLSELTGGLLYHVMGKKRPILIQRQLGMREHERTTPDILASTIEKVISLGVSKNVHLNGKGTQGSGLMIWAKRLRTK